MSTADEGRHRPERVRLLTFPESLRALDVSVGMKAVSGMLVLAVVVTLVLAGRWFFARQAGVPAPEDRVPIAAHEAASATPEGALGGAGSTGQQAQGGVPPGVDGQPDGSGQPGGGTTGAEPDGPDGAPADGLGEDTGSALPQTVFVHVAGQVAEPGVVELPVGSRVIDAVTAAGGLGPDADHSALNLARPVVDGEQVWVGRPGEEPPAAAGAPPQSAGSPPGADGANGAAGSGGAGDGGSGAGGSGTGGATGAQVNLNTADQTLLETLPGVGPVTAGQILAWRAENGQFVSVDELLEISGIGERTLAKLEPMVTVGN
ncbi:helix-hairpin-helix domain-containing protein [Ornithinimicrobium sp. Y1694]|uniref:helix-hairpin-helix domain-containing protein n=1 Tax=Ornithinimicrobium sp. Y1694 TaxID=3418590 RepID=UPI003CF917BB